MVQRLDWRKWCFLAVKFVAILSFKGVANAQDLNVNSITPQMDPTSFVGNLYATYVQKGEEAAIEGCHRGSPGAHAPITRTSWAAVLLIPSGL